MMLQDLRKCIEHTSDEHTLDTLHALSTSRYQSDILGKRISLLDILEVYGKISIPFAEYLGLLPPMRPRHYSISSSPLRDPKTCSITYGVINTDSMAGTSRFQGVAGNYLGSLRPHDAVQVSVRAAPPAFHLPASPSTTPIMMFCNGTGLAPFHGFCQERAMQLAANPHQKLAPALLFVGCRGPTADALYYDEFAEWVRNGVVDVRYAFSRDPDHHLALGCKYVQDRMLLDKDDVREMWRAGAKVYVCGSPDMVKGVKEVTRRLVEEKMGDVSQETVESFFRGMRNERIAVDVFA
jgi:cytochrome P450/NADPH-cytochrome P450 reductase